jgi:ribonucleoside-diphosphate reductase, alpha subunit
MQEQNTNNTSNTINIIKTNGNIEPYNAEKINEKVAYACEGLSGVSVSDVVMNASIRISNNTKSLDIQKALIQSANELVSEETPNYEIVAGRLLNQKLRKEVYNSYEPTKSFYEYIVERVKKGYYDKILLDKYTKEELDFYGSKIKYKQDETLSYISVNQFYTKYLIKNKQGKVIETPQESYMVLNLCVFAEHPERKKYILNGYKFLSEKMVSLPTPIMNGLRTNYKKFISCNVIDLGDSVESLSIALDRFLRMTASKAGIGFNSSRIRGIDADIGGRMKHTGVLPLLKAYESATTALSQIQRNGSSNNNNVWYHYEIELIAQLKDTRGTAETRTRHTDQTIIINNYFLKKALNKEDVYLFHPNQVPGLYEVLGNEEEFAKLYEKYSDEIPKKDKKKVNAYQLLDLILFERSFTGRIYLVFADNIYKGCWKNPVYNVNLCCEVVVPSTPLDGSLGTPEIGSCILGGINHGYVKDDDIEAICDYLVNFLDYMIDYSDYSIPEVEYSAKKRRTLGIGHSDIFHYLAKNKKFYNTTEGRELIHNRIEKCYYYLLKASNELAKTRGKCDLYDDTKYSQGYLSFDEYKDNKETNFKLLMDWKSLRESIKEFGLRTSTVSNTPPFGNSSILSNSTPGIEPPRELITIKGDKTTKIMKLVPEYTRFKNYYTTAWGDDFNNIDYFKFIGIFQKFTDQAISTNQYTNVLRYKDNTVPLTEIIKEILTANKYGLKTLYYQNFLSIENKDGISDEKQEGCGSGGCVV